MKSIVSYPDRGPFGSNRYRGNCSGYLIQDIIHQFNIKQLTDLMVGSGTCKDVVHAEGINGYFADLSSGFDMLNMDIPVRSENIWWHPPYDDIIVYSQNVWKNDNYIKQYGFDPTESDLSRCKNWDDFVAKMNYCMLKQYSSLEKNGRMFVLVGDIKKKGVLYSMQRSLCIPGTLEQIVIKAEHNCWSDLTQHYSNDKFIRIAHEYLLIVKKSSVMIVPVKMEKSYTLNIKDCTAVSWRDLIAAVFEEEGRNLSLDTLYEKLEGCKKAENNRHLKEKIRQTLQISDCFKHVDRGIWSLAA